MEPYLQRLLNESDSKNVQNTPNKKNIKTPVNSEFKNFISNDKALLKDPDYLKIIKIVESLWDSGIIARGAGFCLSMSDMIRKMLYIEGVDCELVECDLTVLNNNRPSMSLIGHDNAIESTYETINSHIVCVTKTKNPILIDLSVFHYKDLTDRPFIVEKITNTSDATLSRFEISGVIWDYNKKQTQTLPNLHQRSILDRIKTDNKIFQNIKSIRIYLIILATISSLNFVRGIFDFTQKYIIKDNNFGPTKVVK